MESLESIKEIFSEWWDLSMSDNFNKGGSVYIRSVPFGNREFMDSVSQVIALQLLEAKEVLFICPTGQTHFKHVYHSQLKNHCQESNETLQEFEADVVRLVRLTDPGTPEKIIERLTVQAFLDRLRDHEIRQVLIMARPSQLVDALWNLRHQNRFPEANLEFEFSNLKTVLNKD
ncbi:hypothetical protein NQ317_013660 [Molorchus minor]|uniref:Uncharacterized protein n=1 Tax=Molorchus minor TaxID=1323400 RepID=A0ABQ9IZI2_9CUCU|nr:hypothetical protein NQ317_013660 [Molorchus minor]